MSNYQARIDAAAAEARRLVGERLAEIRQLIPGFHTQDFERLIKSLSALLEKVDKGNVDHPEYLAYQNGNIAEYCAQLVEGIPSSVEAGTPHFLQTTLPTLLVCEERLFKAVGHYFYQVKELKDRQVREIQKLAEEALEFREEARTASVQTEKLQKSAASAFKSIGTSQSDSQKASDKIKELRDLAIKLASGDGRGKSLEALKRQAEEKLEAIEDVLVKAQSAAAAANNSASQLGTAMGRFKEADTELAGLKRRADSVLALSNQAGLASSYLKESRKLALRSYILTAILYATSIATAVIAAWYVLPNLEHSLASNQINTAGKAIPIALLRATILAPLVYVIYFTTRQISAIETLRMDYAEKAAASLAYSGYKGEMSGDTSLLERLRGSLLLKFAEHPERLLRKRPVMDRIEVETPGFRASSTSAEAGSQQLASQEDEKGDEQE